MAKYPYCSCGGLKIDNNTLKVNQNTGELYSTVGGGASFNVTDLDNNQKVIVPIENFPNNHTLLSTDLFDEYTADLNNYIVTIGENINNLKFTQKIQNGWTVHTSQTNLILASLQIDYKVVTWTATTSPQGCYRCAMDIQENLPTGLFTLAPSINLICYCDNTNYSFITNCIQSPSKDFIGKWEVIMLDKGDTSAVQPTTIHAVMQAIGF